MAPPCPQRQAAAVQLRWGHRARRLALAGFLVGCADSTPEGPVLLGVEPAVVERGSAQAAAIIGEHLYRRGRLLLDSDEIDLGESFVVLVGATGLTPVIAAAPSRLDVTLPAELGLGEHDVFVRTPFGDELSLRDGLLVVEAGGGSGGAGSGGAGSGGDSFDGAWGYDRGAPSVGVGACTSEVADDFEGSVLNGLWMTHGKSGLLSLSAGRLTMRPLDEQPNRQLVGMSTTKDAILETCALWIEVPELVLGGAQGKTSFTISGSSIELEMGVLNGVMYVTDSVSRVELAYDAAAHRWWRVRALEGRVFMETAPSFGSWSGLLEADPPLGGKKVRVTFDFASPTDTSDLGQTQLDNFSVAPRSP